MPRKEDFRRYKRGMLREAKDYLLSVRIDNMNTKRLKKTQLTKEQIGDLKNGKNPDPSYFREVIPTLEGLAIYLDRTVKDIKRFAKERKKFFKIVEEVKAEQCKRLITCGLRGDFNASIVKLLLASHGYIGKKELVAPARDPDVSKTLQSELDRILEGNKIPIGEEEEEEKEK